MNSKLALITFLDGSGGYPDQGLPVPGGPVDPGYGQGRPRPPHPWFPAGGSINRPDQGLPGYGRPDQGLPGYGHPDQGLPGYGHPDQGLPGGGNYPSTGPVPPPVTPDNTLPPTTPPPTISLPIVLPPDPVIDGEQLFELKYSVRYGWVLVPLEDETAQPKKK